MGVGVGVGFFVVLHEPAILLQGAAVGADDLITVVVCPLIRIDGFGVGVGVGVGVFPPLLVVFFGVGVGVALGLGEITNEADPGPKGRYTSLPGALKLRVQVPAAIS